MNVRACSMSHRTTYTPHRPGMVNAQQNPSIKLHIEAPPASSNNSSTPALAIGNLSIPSHLKTSLGGGVAHQSNAVDCNIHLPALSPKRQMVTNGKSLFHVPQHPGVTTPQFLKPKEQEFGNKFTASTVKGAFVCGSQCKSIGKNSCNNLIITSSPMVVQRLGPLSPSTQQVSTACSQISPSLQRAMNMSNPDIPSDTRSLLSRESLASTTLSLSESQSIQSVKQEWFHGYRIYPSLPSNSGSQNSSQFSDVTNATSGISMSNNFSTSLPSYLLSMENNHPPYSSPHHSSARSHSAKKRALSLSPLSDGIGIDFNTIIRTSPTSLVAYINGSRTSPCNISPQPEVYGHFLGIKGSCIPQTCSIPNPQKRLLMANCNAIPPDYSENGNSEYQRMQQLEQSNLQPLITNNMMVQQGSCLVESQPMGLDKGGQGDIFSGNANSVPCASLAPPMLPPPPGPPPPYHAHQHALINHPRPLSLPASIQKCFLDDDSELDDFSGKHCCRWIDCSATYDQQEELVRHIEKIHIDQRKGEDFTCFWAGCPRRYKPFNARYKLLIHMRVHSGEKPNKCTKPYACQIPGCTKRYTDPSSLRKHVKAHSSKDLQARKKLRATTELDQDILNDCLTIQPIQVASSPQDVSVSTVQQSPGHIHDLYPATMFSSIHSNQSGISVGNEPPSHAASLSSPRPSIHESPHNPSTADSGTESPGRILPPHPFMQKRTSQPSATQQFGEVHLKTNGSLSNPSFQPNSIQIQGVYGQLQTFCSPHYTDNQRNIQHIGACNMVPPFEDCLVPTSMGQAGFDVFHKAFSAHSGITVYDFPMAFGDSLRSGMEDASFLHINAVDRCPSQLSSLYMEG
ncbi:PREDICTED: zinc finger protein GLIS3 isoform X2 [Thamnophis sirtalis]|uniref:Zinc finger protein GLIS3 isoform X2 n=1 Tax=Thamnophis sirtalis TaxID=35019 RepID=A0A6I9XA21_9SAUR|nr:PREDICTED: zinc finger protein GLIS3 isoform X2 [Thamnophis sirtalis]